MSKKCYRIFQINSIGCIFQDRGEFFWDDSSILKSSYKGL